MYTPTRIGTPLCAYIENRRPYLLCFAATQLTMQNGKVLPLSLWLYFPFVFLFYLSFVCLLCVSIHLFLVVLLNIFCMWFFYFIRYSVSFYFCCISASILYSMCLSISRYYCVLSLPLFYIEDAFLFLAIIVFYLYLSVRLLLSSFRVSRSQECLKTVVAHSVYFIILSFFYHSVYFVCLANIPFSCLSLSNSRFDCLLVFQRKRFFTWSLSIF